jgi:hypothetical protein
MMVPLDGLRRVRVIATYEGHELTFDYEGQMAAAIVRAGRARRHTSEPIPAHEHDIHRDMPTGRHRQPQGSTDFTSAS